MAYTFYLDKMKIPITPSSLEISIRNQNKTIVLMNEGEINLLKMPGLSEVSFSFIIPQLDKKFADDADDASTYLELLEDIKVNQVPFQFIVYREFGDQVLFKTNMTVSLEEYTLTEDAERMTDILVSVKLKQYREWGTKKISIKKETGSKKSAATKKPTPKKTKKVSKSYTVKAGDTLWLIAKLQLGSGDKWETIYEKNKSVIEAAAKKRGYASSSNGHWIFPGTKLSLG